jgi:hypothetical protein
VEFDLLGDPIPESRGKVGRTGHVATGENALLIRHLLTMGVNLSEIAKQMGLSVPTLRKHYFANGRIKVGMARRQALAMCKAENFLRLQEQARAGNVSAMGKIHKILADEARSAFDAEMRAERDKVPKKPAPKGKKDSEKISAIGAEADLAAFLGKDRVH